MSLFVSPRAQQALATVNAPSHLEKGHESQAQPDPSPPKLQAELRRFHLLQLGFGRVGHWKMDRRRLDYDENF